MMKIDSDGYKFCALFLAGSLTGWAGNIVTQWPVFLWVLWICLFLALYTLYFFRDPARTVPDGDGIAVSSADGVVVDVSTVGATGFKDGKALRIAVFMNVFNVHVNRSPVSGKVVKTVHRNGKKLSAYNKRAEHENEHGDTDIDTLTGTVRIRQIAGLIARRVVTRVKVGDELKKGGRIGLIRFGSRVDVFLPEVYSPTVTEGQRVFAGETIIARLTVDEDHDNHGEQEINR